MTPDHEKTMRAVVLRRYGGPECVNVETVPVPKPKRGELLVRVHASPVTAGDVRLRSAQVPRGFGFLVRAVAGWTRPRQPIPGWGFSGVVAETSADVKNFKVGDRVMGVTGFSGGAHAEYLTTSETGKVLPLPPTLTLEQGAAFFFGGLTAADFLIDKGRVQRGEQIAIVGATGSVGSAAMSIARHLGARVTAVCSTDNLEFARSLGAEEVVDYRSQTLTGSFDAILDVMGVLPRERALSLLRPGGRLLPVTSTLTETLGAALKPRRGEKTITGTTIAETREKMQRLVELHNAGAYSPAVSRSVPLAQAAEAHALAESWHKRGNVLLLM